MKVPRFVVKKHKTLTGDYDIIIGDEIVWVLRKDELNPYILGAILSAYLFGRNSLRHELYPLATEQVYHSDCKWEEE